MPKKAAKTKKTKRGATTKKSPKAAKIKVAALAEKLSLEAKELLKILKDLGVEVKTTASSVEEETAQLVREYLEAEKEPAKETEAEQEVEEEKEERVGQKAAAEPLPEEEPTGPVLEAEDITVKELAEKIQAKPSEIIKQLMIKGLMANINQRITADMAREIAGAVGKQLRIKKPEITHVQRAPEIGGKNLAPRPPIVTIMGHVDHGKTKLLDAIRKTRVAEGEAGGITQHIGAYQVNVHGRKVTFLDTPGHEAFTALRARGAKVTDIAVLVVAADDGVKPQTVEAIDHARAAGVPIVVAVNKIDKEGANPDKVKQQLSDLDLMPEEWGGKTVTVATSAISGKGINELLEMILLVAEMQELKADPGANPVGVVIESRLDKGRGPVASVLVKNGTIKIGDIFTLGFTYGKVRALFNEKGTRLEKAGPATPVELLGCAAVPEAGDILEVVASEKEARALAEQKTQKQKTKRAALSLEDFSKHIKEGERKDLKLVIKADVQGSIDAIVQSLQNIVIGNIHINIIHSAAGAVTASDVMLAEASDAIIVAFNVAFEGNAEAVSQAEGVEVRKYNIIYKLIDDVKLAMEGMLEPVYEEVTLGRAEVRALFKYSKVGVIAGCFVKDGKLVRGSGLRVFRGPEKIYEGKLDVLKRFKDDVKSVEQNYECGVSVNGYDGFKVGDELESFEMREKKRKR